MRKSELYNLLNNITLKFIDNESPTVREIRRLEKLTNEDLLIMEDEEMESFILGMWQGVKSFIREQEEMWMNFKELKDKVLIWANDKDLLHSENAEKQFMKFIEEVFELKAEMDLQEIKWDSGMDKTDIVEPMKLEMGDILVTLIILSSQLEIDLTECLEMAYQKISKRKGKTIDGLFVKKEE